MSTDPRIEDLITLLSTLAAGDFEARGRRSEADDEIAAVIEGVNMLAEELQAGSAELEKRVQERTAELQAVNRDILQLAELGNRLQACETLAESYAVTSQGLQRLFPGVAGAVYLFRPSQDALETRASWGDYLSAEERLLPGHCWALRRGMHHFVGADNPFRSCSHVGEPAGDSLCVPMSAHGETIGLLHLVGAGSPGPGRVRLTTSRQRMAVAVAEQVSLALSNQSLRDTLRSQALRDPLTGLHNRRFVDEWMGREVDRSVRTGQSIGVIMADVDHFKRVNDVHGHKAGDVLLRAIAGALTASLRPGDILCRYGGEEFLLLLTDIDMEFLYDRAETLRERVASLHVTYRGSPLPRVTLSAGVASYPRHGVSAADVLNEADTALYAAKRAGRDRTRAAGGAAHASG